jgi:hypothetical protein
MFSIQVMTRIVFDKLHDGGTTFVPAIIAHISIDQVNLELSELDAPLGIPVFPLRIV